MGLVTQRELRCLVTDRVLIPAASFAATSRRVAALAEVTSLLRRLQADSKVRPLRLEGDSREMGFSCKRLAAEFVAT